MLPYSPRMAHGETLASLESILCTQELHRRPARAPDYATENRALVALAQALADSPRSILQTLTDTILAVFEAGSAGLSLLSKDEQSFFWPAVSGLWQAHVGGGTPRNFGPCGDVLDCNAPLLFRGVERRYPYFLAVTPPAEECLLVPFYVDGKAVGTIWAVAHDERRKFDAEDLRQLESLGRFASAAYQATQAQEALRVSEASLRDFVEHASVGLQRIGPDGTILWANKTQLDLLGYTPDEYLGHSLAQFHHDPPAIEDIFARLTVGETLLDYAARLRCKDGSIRHVLINSNTLFEDGKFIHTRCFTHDITAHTQAEEALRYNEWRLRYAIESARLTYVEVDLARGEARTAENFAAVMGYPSPPEQEVDVAVGTRVLLEHVVPQDRARVSAALLKYIDGTPVGKIDYRVLGDDWKERWIQSRWSIQHGPDGKSLKSFATNLNITELKQVEEALRTSEEQVRLALDSAELGSFNIDLATNALTTDDRFRAIFGTPAARIDYKQAFAIVYPEDRTRLRVALAAATRRDDPVAFIIEYRVVHPDGTLRWVFARGRAHFDQEGPDRKLRSFNGTVADITERKQAEAALRASEEFNRSIIDSSPDCIKVLDLKGNLLSMHNGQALLGIEDIRPYLNKSWIAFWEGGDHQAARAAVEAAAAGREGRFVGFFRTLRDEAKWWDVTISPMRDANNQPARLLAVSRDVTERKRAETNFEFLSSVSQDLAQLTDMNEAMATVGAKIGVHLGLSLCAFVQINEAADEVVITHDWHRDDVPSLVGVHRLANFVGEDFIRTARAGEIIVVRATAADPHTDTAKFAALGIASFVCVPLIQDGQWRFAMGLYHSAAYGWREDEIELARELTTRVWTRMERLRAEEALRQSEERYRNLFNSMDEGYCVIEMIFDEHEEPVDWRFLEVNRSFAKQTGLDEIVGKRMRELAPDHEAYWFETYGKVVLTGEPVRFINEAKAMNRWFDLYAFRLGGPDSFKVAVLFTDISERLQSDRALSKAVETLADLDRRKDEFLAMLSHELRNPLAPISNAVKLLQLQKNQNPIQQQARTIIERQVGTLKHLIDDLLEISRINTGRVQLRLERIVLSGVVERAVETVRPLIAQRRQDLTLSVPPHPLWLHADAARLEQVVVNLLTNAAKYTDEGGHLWLSVEQEGDRAVLRVRDTGIGIAPELLPRIFDLFTQAEPSLDRSQGGLGIGLCLVQRLVDLHGGTVKAYSILGQGSEFVVRLPVMLDSMAPLPLPSPSIETAAPPEKYHRVLVVDDNVDAAQSLAILLQAFGHDVRIAYDGPDAVKAALEFQPDVVLLDIGLPGLSGLEVARWIRKHAGLENIVLVAMTGYGQATDREHSQEAGCDHHLVKPVDFDQVRKILASVAQKAEKAA